MNFVMEFFKVTGHFLWWTVVNVLWKPTKWVAVGTYTAWKSSRKPKFKTDDAVSDAQAAAAKNLPELTKKLEEVSKKMAKLSGEWSTLNAEKQRIESVIYVASGEFVKPRAKSNSNNKSNNNNNQQKQKGNNNQQNNNNGQKKVPAIGDADFAN